MLSEILKIKPQLDNSDLAKMERNLNARFRRVAKRFGQGIVSVFKAGGGIGLVLGFINKFLNPLKETQEAIERLLTSSDDISTNAKQFETTTGKLFKLIQLAKASGLDQESLFNMLSRFQTGIGKVRQDGNDPLAPALGQFTNDSDLVDSFYSFLNSLKSLDFKDQAVVKSAVFGERQSLKINDFLQQDFLQRLKETGLDKYTAAQLSKAGDKLAGLSDLKGALDAQRETADFIKKSQIINEQMIRENAKAEQIQLDRENQRIRSYQDLQAISQTTDRIMNLVEQGIQMLGGFINQMIPKFNRLLQYLETFSKSRLVRGVKGIGDWFKGDN